MYTKTSGEVLGATTAIGGIMSLPNTGDFSPMSIVIYLATAIGLLVVVSSLIARFLSFYDRKS